MYILLLVPKVVTICTHLIEEEGIIDGIYRQSGVSSNIKRLMFVNNIYCILLKL